ncbi:MAG: SUF system NifU family Fe-S cluster assembly protein [Gemmatimonadales bacterium]
MSELDDLYQSLILDHNRSPRNFRSLGAPSGTAEGKNPLCGDAFTVGVQVEDGVVTDVGFTGQGCAISKASASMMTTVIRGKRVEEAEQLFQRFHQVVTGNAPADEEARTAVRKQLGCLSAFSGVSAFPIRVKCATLAWHTMMEALRSAGSEASPEHQ